MNAWEKAAEHLTIAEQELTEDGLLDTENRLRLGAAWAALATADVVGHELQEMVAGPGIRFQNL